MPDEFKRKPQPSLSPHGTSPVELSPDAIFQSKEESQVKTLGKLASWGPFLESPSNLPDPISDFGDKCFLTEVNFCYL